MVATTAVAWNSLFSTFAILGTIVGIIVIGYLLVQAIRYRAKQGQPEPEDAPKLGELPREVGKGSKLFVSVGLSAVVLAALVAGSLALFEQYEKPPAGTIDVKVIGFQFGWKFIYPNGKISTGDLRVPKGEVVRLHITSEDVFHNFGVIEFRLKSDAIPGKTNMVWFRALETGIFRIQCFELCGFGHAFMLSRLTVMEQGDFQQWYAS